MTQTLSPSQRRDWVRLARTDMVGAVSFGFLLKRYGNPTKALDILPTGFQGREREAASAIPSREEIEAELEAGAALGARLLLSCDPYYPPNLATLDARGCWPAPPAYRRHSGRPDRLGRRPALCPHPCRRTRSRRLCGGVRTSQGRGRRGP